MRLRSDGNLALQNGVSFLDQLLLDSIFLDLLLPELGCILALSDLDLLLEVNLVLVLLKFGQLLFDLASLVQVLDGFLALVQSNNSKIVYSVVGYIIRKQLAPRSGNFLHSTS